MRQIVVLIGVVMLAVSCEQQAGLPPGEEKLLGFWLNEEMLFNGDDLKAHGIFEQNFLELSGDRNAAKAYTFGKWTLNGSNLSLSWQYAAGIDVYRVVSVTQEELVLEYEVSPKQYHAETRAFQDRFGHLDFVTVRKTLKRANP